MADAIIGGITGAIVGVISFVVIKNLLGGADRTYWTRTERAVMDVIPVIVGVVVLIGMFTSLQMARK